jgi:enoyl-CoA hydratase/carnithine racemase
LCPEFGSSLILPRLLGHAKAAELLLLGEGFSGEQAAAWGIATEALGSGEAALAKAREMALRFESLPPEAVRISKQLMKAPDREQLRTVIEEEGDGGIVGFYQPTLTSIVPTQIVGAINKKPRHSHGGAFAFQQPITQTIGSPTCRIFIPLVPPMVW